MSQKFITPLFFLLIFTSCFFNGYAQEKTIYGFVISDINKPIIGATVVTEENLGLVTDTNGFFKLEIPANKKEIKLSIRRLGFYTLETTLTTIKDSLQVTFRLKEKIFNQPEVEILYDESNAFNNINWKLIDYLPSENNLIILYQLKKEKRVGIFNQSGYLISEYDLEERYDEIQLSCTGTILLIGKEYCLELFSDKKNLHFLKKHLITSYEQQLAPCIVKLNNELLFKFHTKHNKHVEYKKFITPGNPVILASIIDQEEFRLAQTYFDKIIKAYYSSTSDPRKFEFDLPIYPNLIELGMWNGNMNKLAVNLTLDLMTIEYLRSESKPLKVEEFVLNNELYLLNYADSNLLRITKNKRLDTLNFKNYSWNSDHNLLIDAYQNKFYLLSDNEVIQEFVIREEKAILKEQKQLNLDGQFQDHLRIHDNTVYYVADYMSGIRKLRKQKL